MGSNAFIFISLHNLWGLGTGESMKYFSKREAYLWITSMAFIIVSFLIYDRENYLTLTASVIGVTSLIFNAKGNPIGQVLMVVFSILYGIISYSYLYYGEMITYQVGS